MSGKDAAGRNNPLPSLCRYHRTALDEEGVTDHDIDQAAAHGMDCRECRRVVGDILQARIDAHQGG